MKTLKAWIPFLGLLLDILGPLALVFGIWWACDHKDPYLMALCGIYYIGGRIKQ